MKPLLELSMQCIWLFDWTFNIYKFVLFSFHPGAISFEEMQPTMSDLSFLSAAVPTPSILHTDYIDLTEYMHEE